MGVKHASCTVPEFFLNIIQEHPQLEAVVQGENTFTYQQLYEKVCAIANKLESLGITKGQLVGVYSERSFDQIASYLAIWFVGGVYLPIDPKNPSNRITRILQSSKCKCVLIGSANETQRFEILKIISVAKVKGVTVSQIDHNQKVRFYPVHLETSSPAYVIYTSGSTGEPKGVLVSHAGITNLAHWYRTKHHFKRGERFSMIASTGFDASISEIWPVIAIGGTLCIPETEVIVDPQRLIDWFCAFRVNAGYIPTVLLEHIFELSWPKGHKPRTIFTGGDRLRKDPPTGFPCKLVNQYGPTEATDISLEIDLIPGETSKGAPPIGSPVDNVHTLVVDEKLKEVSKGTKGELLIGGVGLAIGYLNDPQKTEEKFITRNGERYYRTGDIVWQNTQGLYEFDGRKDFQVQVLGQRVELGEIEKQILALATIRNVAVLLKSINGQGALISYYTSDVDEELKQEEFIDQLRANIPDYMIPKIWIRLNKLPLSVNGKIDRKALPDPVVQSRKIVQPTNATEKIITDFIEDILNQCDVSIEDNFFHIGGNSLLGGMLLGKINQHFGKQLPLSVLMEANTAQKLAQLIENNEAIVAAENLVSVRKSGDGIPLFCIHGFGGYGFKLANLENGLSGNYPFYVIQGSGIDPHSSPHDNVLDMALHYVKVIQSVQKCGPYRILGYSFGGNIGIEIARILMEKGEEIDFFGMVDTFGPGYPKVLPPYLRALDHFRNFFLSNSIDRMDYIKARLDNILRRVNKLLNRAHQKDEKAFDEIENPISEELFLAHEKAADEYQAKEINLKSYLFRATIDPNYPGTDFSDQYMGWKPYFHKGLEIKYIDGDHFTLLNPSHVKGFGKLIEECYDTDKKPFSH